MKSYQNPTLWNIDLEGNYVELTLGKGAHDTFFVIVINMPDCA